MGLPLHEPYHGPTLTPIGGTSPAAPHLGQENSSKTPFCMRTSLDMIGVSQSSFWDSFPAGVSAHFYTLQLNDHTPRLSPAQGSHMVLAESCVISLPLADKKVGNTAPRGFPVACMLIFASDVQVSLSRAGKSPRYILVSELDSQSTSSG